MSDQAEKKQRNHVIKLDLPSSCLQDSINSSSGLFKLIHLKWLILLFNKFSGFEILIKIINLSRLSYLNLFYSSLSGGLPVSTKYLRSLKVLAIIKCNFCSRITFLLRNLTQLIILHLSQNSFRGRI
ncbi:hypothetical protein CISIN_1g037844mg, partial [Citrus sinensis]